MAYKCQSCSALRDDERDDSPRPCPTCGAREYEEITLAGVGEDDDEKYVCETCGAEFPSEAARIGHQNAHA